MLRRVESNVAVHDKSVVVVRGADDDNVTCAIEADLTERQAKMNAPTRKPIRRVRETPEGKSTAKAQPPRGETSRSGIPQNADFDRIVAAGLPPPSSLGARATPTREISRGSAAATEKRRSIPIPTAKTKADQALLTLSSSHALKLFLATAPGAEMRQALGTAVLSGMSGVTLLGLFFAPCFYVMVRGLTGRGR